jgi:hypothetical protein
MTTAETEDSGHALIATATDVLRRSGLGEGWRATWSARDTPSRAVIIVRPDPLPSSGLDAEFWAAIRVALNDREAVLAAAGLRVQREHHARWLLVTRMSDPEVVL